MIAGQPLQIAVVGHTNHGKTSLVRTLTWTRDFGEVADRRAVTRRVEWIDIQDENDEPIVRLYDTPGLEDSINLRDAIESMRQSSRDEGRQLISRFLDQSAAVARFPQPVKAIRQMLQCDVLLNVIDARQRTLAKYRDELEVMRWANPRIVNVLNFTAHRAARTQEWNDLLMRGGFGYVASFDVVALRPADEIHLLETIRRLVAQTPGSEAMDRFTRLRRAQWRYFRQQACRSISELLVDVAACTVQVPRDSGDRSVKAIGRQVMQNVREREHVCYRRILELRGMGGQHDQRLADLQLPHDGWKEDLFDRAQLKAIAKLGGGGAAAGAMVGAIFDVAAAGLTFGIGTATGAALGGLAGTARTQARSLRNRLAGVRDVSVSNVVITNLAQRQWRLLDRLLHRGHAVALDDPADQGDAAEASASSPEDLLDGPALRQLLALLHKARGKARWSTLSGHCGSAAVQTDAGSTEERQPALQSPGADDPARARVVDRVGDLLGGLSALSGEDPVS